MLQCVACVHNVMAGNWVIWQLQGDRVAVAAGIRLSTWLVQKVDTLKWKLAGLVNPDAEFDSTNRSGWSRAVRWCLEIL